LAFRISELTDARVRTFRRLGLVVGPQWKRRRVPDGPKWTSKNGNNINVYRKRIARLRRRREPTKIRTRFANVWTSRINSCFPTHPTPRTISLSPNIVNAHIFLCHRQHTCGWAMSIANTWSVVNPKRTQWWFSWF